MSRPGWTSRQLEATFVVCAFRSESSVRAAAEPLVTSRVWPNLKLRDSYSSSGQRICELLDSFSQLRVVDGGRIVEVVVDRVSPAHVNHQDFVDVLHIKCIRAHFEQICHSYHAIVRPIAREVVDCP